jgi:SAM-dependent methyltransferase
MMGSIKNRLIRPILPFYQMIRKITDRTINRNSYLQIQSQMKEFKKAPDDMLSSKVESKTDIKDLVYRFHNLNISVREIKIDVKDVENWLKEYAEIRTFYKGMGDVAIEKSLEHYLTMKHLGISRNDIYIDIAAAASPFADIAHKHLGNKTFTQDLIYKQGIHGNKIGGDAGNMPIPDNFADVLTLHCAYECFQGDADMRFIKEAGRVLKKGGRLGIVPLYVDSVYFVKTGPKYDKRKVNVEKETRWIWRDDKYDKEPFSRHYSPESFKTRVINHIGNLKYEILWFTNLKDLENRFEGQRFYCHFFFKAVKE